jgi:flagellar motor protein MotB
MRKKNEEVEQIEDLAEEAKEEEKNEEENQEEEMALKNLTSEDLSIARDKLRKYKDYKGELERRIRNNEEWWKLRHWGISQSKEDRDAKHMAEPVSAWLHNSINNKHADMMDNYPEPMVLPREESDDPTAKTLTAILPVILEYNDYEQVYSDSAWYKLKQGCSAKIVGWNSRKNNGLGDVDIRRIDLLNLFWEPGISDIQDSENVFHVQLVSNDILRKNYPDAAAVIGNKEIDLTQYVCQDAVDDGEKTAVIDWYYKRDNGTREVLHYCKFVGDVILYASENDPDYAERGFYDHGKYPFVLDSLFIQEGSPAGFGYIDIMRDPQMYIDKMNQVILDTSVKSSKARYFISDNAGVNEEEFNDWTKEVIHYSGNPDGILPFNQIEPSAANMNVLQHKIEELKETSGNRDFSQGSTQSGVTAATAIAALQEAGSKLSRDMIKATYRSFKKECELVIELIRQFYDEPRKFRILGEKGDQEFRVFSNDTMRAIPQGEDFGVDLGEKQPVFDVSVAAAKKSTYSRMSQNELALQFYGQGFFAPGNADASLACLDMMEFEGKEKIMQKVEQNGTLYQQCMAMQQQIAQLQAMLGGPAVAPGVSPGNVKGSRGEGAKVDMDNLGGAKPRSEMLENAKNRTRQMAQV